MNILLLLIFIILIVVIAFYVYKESIGYVVTHYSISSEKILKDEVKIAFLSDLHNMEHGEKNSSLLKEIEKENPDFIVFAGDMITSKPKRNLKYDNTLEFIANLTKKWPVYYGMGNHEARLKRLPEVYNGKYNYNDLALRLKEIGAPLIVNEKIELNEYGIDIYGLDLAHEYYRKIITNQIPGNYLRHIFGDVDKEKYSILLAHNPEHFDISSEWGEDLMLSGHVHGGIIRLPYIGGVISPALKLFPKYDGGLFKKNNSIMILSRGIGTHSIPIRVNNKAEIIFIDIKKEKNGN